MNKRELARAVVGVDGGRGFVLQLARERVVVTAAHCLPNLPPCNSASYLQETTFQDLLGPLKQKQTRVWAECLFADPIADIAVLGRPDYQELGEQAEAFEALIDAAVPLKMGDVQSPSKAWLLSLDNKWFRCTVQYRNNGGFWINDAAKEIRGGMSGSPIISDDGAAIGIVCVAGGTMLGHHTAGGPNPRLRLNLPGWVLAESG
jgi:hypothetical protein